MIEKAIYSILTGDATVLALTSTRVRPVVALQGASLPYVIYQQISGPRYHTTSGPIGMADTLYQVNCWASTYSDMKTLSEAVRKAMDGYSGTIASVVIDVIHIQDESDIPDLSADTNINRYGKRLDFRIWFKETP